MFFTSVFVPSAVSPFAAHRHVRIAAQASLFHIPVADAEIGHELTDQDEGVVRLARRAQVRFGHDLDQRRRRTG